MFDALIFFNKYRFWFLESDVSAFWFYISIEMLWIKLTAGYKSALWDKVKGTPRNSIVTENLRKYFFFLSLNEAKPLLYPAIHKLSLEKTKQSNNKKKKKSTKDFLK